MLFAFTAISLNAGDPAPEIQRLLQSRHDAGDFNGSALVARAGHIIYEQSIGFANLEWRIPIDSH